MMLVSYHTKKLKQVFLFHSVPIFWLECSLVITRLQENNHFLQQKWHWNQALLFTIYDIISKVSVQSMVDTCDCFVSLCVVNLFLADTVARERIFNRVVKTNLFRLGAL